ncbi:hypothetical protein Mapa_011787 [Marchantia paleacea]|nr:hypothetical protein Mapa_011787 [Marchantia paleacea]
MVCSGFLILYSIMYIKEWYLVLDHSLESGRILNRATLKTNSITKGRRRQKDHSLYSSSKR